MLLTEMHLPHSAIRVILDLRNPPPLGLLQATGRNHDVEVRHKVETSAEGLLYNADDQAYAIASPCPLLDGLCSMAGMPCNMCRFCWRIIRNSIGSVRVIPT